MPPKNKNNKDEESSEISSVEVAFVLNDPSTEDNSYHSCKVQLSRALQGNKSFDEHISDIANEICEQCEVGSFLCVEGEEEWGCHGFISALSCRVFKEKPWIKSIISMLSNSTNNKNKLIEFFKDRHVAVLLQNRFINIPAFMVAPIYSNLIDDLEWTQKSFEVENKKDFDFDAFIILATLFDEDADEEDTPKKKTSESIYLFPEYFLFEDFCELIVDLPASIDASKVVGRQPRGFKALLMTKEKLEQAIQSIKKEIGE